MSCLEFDTDPRFYDLRWDECDARLTLGYCLGSDADGSAETEDLDIADICDIVFEEHHSSQVTVSEDCHCGVSDHLPHRSSDTEEAVMTAEDMPSDPPDLQGLSSASADVRTITMEVEDMLSDLPDVQGLSSDSTVVVETGDVATTTVDVEVYSDDEASVSHLLKLVRALATDLGSASETPSASASASDSDGVGGGNTNLGFEDSERLGREGPLGEHNSQVTRASSWLRASMRRVRRFALEEPPPGPQEDFPRRYSRRPADQPSEPSQPSAEDETSSDYDEPEETKDWWPHSLSSLLASLGCTLGLFNVSRFAILSVHFGANFVIQFLFLSLLVGWPLYTLNASLGQHIKAGVVDMWRISPLFQGIGIALLLAQAMLGLYSVVGVAWMFTYFRDSFINKYDAYRWAENGTKVEESIPDYLNTVVLQRHGSSSVGHLKFQVTFNLAVVWMIVFVCLSKGIKSYGKSVYFFAAVPIFGISILAIKVLTLTDLWFDHTAWNELFVNSNCWTAAAIECMMTWGLLGAATMQMRSHSACCRLSRECLAVGAITIATLVSAALLANGFAQLLWSSNLRYVPSSFEHSAIFLYPVGAPRLSSTPVRWMPHGHHVVGLQVSLPGTPVDSVSGYQAAQFATELAPAVFAKLGPQAVSPFWTVLFYFTLILLGLSQQLCIWHCVITGIMAINITRLRSWETTITFLSCSCGFVLGLPMTTELGIAVVYFMDYCVGGAWWLILLQAAQIIAALMAQGGEPVAHTLLGSRRSCLQAFVVFTWNVVLPLALTVVSVTWFRSNHYRDLYSNRHHGYWPAWVRRLGCFLQLIPLILVPVVAAVQTWRYLTKGPNDLFDRLRLLCRPGPGDTLANQTTTPVVSPPSQPLPEIAPVDDPPPKYTPPPSYSTATGARIAKMLRRSFRRLVAPSVPSPPDYSAVLVEMGGSETAGRTSTLSAVEVAHILRSSMRRTLRREQVHSDPSPTHDSLKTDPVI